MAQVLSHTSFCSLTHHLQSTRNTGRGELAWYPQPARLQVVVPPVAPGRTRRRRLWSRRQRPRPSCADTYLRPRPAHLGKACTAAPLLCHLGGRRRQRHCLDNESLHPARSLSPRTLPSPPLPVPLSSQPDTITECLAPYGALSPPHAHAHAPSLLGRRRRSVGGNGARVCHVAHVVDVLYARVSLQQNTYCTPRVWRSMCTVDVRVDARVRRGQRGATGPRAHARVSS